MKKHYFSLILGVLVLATSMTSAQAAKEKFERNTPHVNVGSQAQSTAIPAKYKRARSFGGLTLAILPHNKKGEMGACLDHADSIGSTAKEALHDCFCLVLGQDGDTGC
ncbi:MAG: hypothetical protein ACI8P9_005772 [Parasphingorhabdus sp.]|jgi:hypothetical protein